MIQIDSEFKSLIPALTQEEYQQLEDNILHDGIRDPLVVWNGVLIDGHNRYDIAHKHGIAFDVQEKEFADRAEAERWIILNQFGRRNLSAYDRSVLALKLKPIIAAKAKENQGSRNDIPKKSWECEEKQEIEEIKSQHYSSEAELALIQQTRDNFNKRRRNEERNRNTYIYFMQIDDKMKVGSSYDLESRLEQLRVSAPTIKMLDFVLFGDGAKKHENNIKKRFSAYHIDGEVYRYTEDIFRQMLAYTKREVSRKNETDSIVAKAAGVSHDTIAKVEKIQAKATPEVKKAVKSGEMSINQAYQAVKREEKAKKQEERRQENAEKVEKLATPLEAQGLFQTIVIDPPWDWGDEGDVSQFGRAKPEYTTMPIEEIENMPINKIADDNCHLYLWVTNRSLPKAFRLVEAWGFRYITCLTWVKPYFGMGNYFRGSTEQVIFAVKGSQALKRHDVGTHFTAPRGEGHSAKPDEFYKLVESCSYGPYIDVFGRKSREGWAVWGENG